MIVRKALIIDSPWIEYILKGEKIWEMRSQRAKHRGPFGLIQKGSGQVKGIAHLDSTSGPYNNAELEKYSTNHKVGPDLYQQPDYKWRYAWELSHAQRLIKPVNYIHKNGAVTWVDLDEAAVQAIYEQLNGIDASTQISAEPVERSKTAQPSSPSSSLVSGLRVPIAKDGTMFTRDLHHGGTYTVGNKGDETRFDNYNDALKYLQSMPTAKWRRPNASGNWGIVSAVDWIIADDRESMV